MKYFKILSVMIFFPIALSAQAVNTVFTYQGELVVNGSPANGNYDMAFDAYDMLTGGSSLLLFGADIHTNVTVTNGIFTISDVDFGNLVFTGGADTWIELAVKPVSSGTYNTLSPRQKITSAPYAIKADFSNTATSASDLSVTANANDVLVYDGTNWKSGGNKIRVSSVGVSVGTTSIPPTNGIRVGGVLKADGNAELNSDLSVIGSTVMGPSFLGTATSTLDINSTAAGVTDDPFRVRKNDTIKFYVDSNGGASVGSWNTPDANGLRVNGNTKLESELIVQGKMKQNFTSKGLVKYMMFVSCASNNSALARSVNNTERTLPGTGLAAFNYSINGTCGIELPDEIGSDGYWLASANSDGGIATCRQSGTSSGRTALRCEIRNSAGILSDGAFMLFVY
jgi:hypothetical protein